MLAHSATVAAKYRILNTMSTNCEEFLNFDPKYFIEFDSRFLSFLIKLRPEIRNVK